MMNEKVKLPKRLYDALQDYGLPEDGNESLPVFTISDLCDYWRENESSVLGTYIAGGTENHWRLIDVLRYGYEAEPEPRWGIKAGNCYMTNTGNYGFDNITPETAIYWEIKSFADDIVKTLGFGEVVDLNKESKADKPESEQLYYVQFIENDDYSFLNSSDSDGLEISDNEETKYAGTKFTMPEIEAIDPRYKVFAVSVGEVDGDMNKETKADE